MIVAGISITGMVFSTVPEAAGRHCQAGQTVISALDVEGMPISRLVRNRRRATRRIHSDTHSCQRQSGPATMGPLALMPWTEGLDTLTMEFTLTEEADLEIVRRNLDDLVVARSLWGWSTSDRDRYEYLCERERSLMWPLVSH